MDQQTTVGDVVAELKRLDHNLDPESETFRYALALLSSAIVGPNIGRIQEFTGLPKRFLQTVSIRARTNKMWIRGKIHADWFGDNGGISFWMDVATVQGLVARAVKP